MRRTVAALVCFLALLAARAYAEPDLIKYPMASESSVRPPDDCARWFPDACKNWKLGAWLPTLMNSFDAWKHHKASTVAFNDRFLYEPTDNPGVLRSQGGPADGTPFTYGTAGPPRGTAVYDYANAIAFYTQGCCSWGTAVLAAEAGAPPVPVVHRRLINLRTAHGIALGESLQCVQALYGKATPQRLPDQPGMVALSYTHAMNEYKNCRQFQNFVFLHGRLVFIELLNGC